MIKINNSKTKLKFIDLFCGIGGFHYALNKLGHECVFASDINKPACKVYEINHELAPLGDITQIPLENIEDHDILCAGFPCQAFSNAGHKNGFEDTRGTLFFNIAKIIDEKNKKGKAPKFIILENVKHLVKHDNGKTYKVIKESLNELGYSLPSKDIIMSPHMFGIPQRRERIYILGIKRDEDFRDMDLNYDYFDIPNNCKKIELKNILDNEIVENNEKYIISDYEKTVLNAWDVFKSRFYSSMGGFPVWVDYLDYSGNFDGFPKWKIDYITKNKKLYNSNKTAIDSWISEFKVRDFKTRDRKFEWQAGKNFKSVWDTFIQLRQSGIRCKKPDYFPTLVAIVQTPIIGKYKRRLTPREASRLQSFPETFKLDTNEHQAYKQLGNSVNVDVVKYLAEKLLNYQNEYNTL
jgi:DNA (cytosine-5)-methyltransferase 1